jgi:mRNA interferase MazF
MVKRFEAYLVNLDDEVSDDPKNSRPGVVISPDEMNRNLEHVIIAPLSSTTSNYPTRIPTEFLNSERHVILDQLRTVDKNRLVKKIGDLDKKTIRVTLDLLQEMFTE